MNDRDLDRKVVGSIKEAIGKVTGNDLMRAEGEADKDAARHLVPERRVPLRQSGAAAAHPSTRRPG